MFTLSRRVTLLTYIFTLFIFSEIHADEAQTSNTSLVSDPTELQTTPLNSQSTVGVDPKDKLVKPPFLNKSLPESAIAYARLPNIWASLGSPSGSSLDPAVGSTPFNDAAQTIKEGFETTLLSEFPEEIRLLAQILTKHIDSPLEAALLKTNANVPANLLLTASMNFDSASSLEDFLIKLSSNIGAQFSLPMDANGFAILELGDLSLLLSWKNELSRIFILAGVDSNLDAFQDLLEDLKSNESSPMRVAESKIDANGTGAFLWIDPPEVISIAEQLGVPKSELQSFSGIGVRAMKSAALGVGTSGGISQLKFIVDMPMMGLRAVVPSIESSPTFNLSGKTNFLITLGLPAKSHIVAYETVVSMGSPESMEGYIKLKKGFAEITGFNPEDIFEFFGQDISIVFGEAGTYFAVRLNDEKAFNAMLEKSVSDFNLKYEKREISDRTYHYLQLPNFSLDKTLEKYLDETTNLVTNRLLSVPTHIYWEQEDDYLFLAGLPQILMDRNHLEPKTPADEWLRNTQHMDSEGALLIASAVTNGVPAAVYRMQLSMLSYFGDITDSSIDLFNLPSPLQTQLPKEGAYGLKLTSTDSEIALELAFEDNPLEVFGGSTYLSTAVAAVATLVGISVQEEYERQQDLAKLAPGFAAAKHVSEVLDKYKAGNGKYPDRLAIDTLDLELEANTYALSIEPLTGRIIITFDVDEYLGGDDFAILEPPTEIEKEWTCSSEIFSFYLPDYCY